MKAETYFRKIRDSMKSVGTYRKEFETSMKTLAQIYEDRDKAREDFEKSGGKFIVKHINKNGSTNLVKNPFIVMIDSFNDKILAYNRELGLTPTGLKKLNEKGLKIEKKDGLESLIEGMFDDM